MTDDTDLVGRIGRAVLAGLLPPRRPRTSVRKVKSPLSRYNKKDPYRPERNTPITELTLTISDPETKDPTRQPKCSTTALGPALRGIDPRELCRGSGGGGLHFTYALKHHFGRSHRQRWREALEIRQCLRPRWHHNDRVSTQHGTKGALGEPFG